MVMQAWRTAEAAVSSGCDTSITGMALWNSVPSGSATTAPCAMRNVRSWQPCSPVASLCDVRGEYVNQSVTCGTIVIEQGQATARRSLIGS